MTDVDEFKLAQEYLFDVLYQECNTALYLELQKDPLFNVDDIELQSFFRFLDRKLPDSDSTKAAIKRRVLNDLKAGK